MPKSASGTKDIKSNAASRAKSTSSQKDDKSSKGGSKSTTAKSTTVTKTTTNVARDPQMAGRLEQAKRPGAGVPNHPTRAQIVTPRQNPLRNTDLIRTNKSVDASKDFGTVDAATLSRLVSLQKSYGKPITITEASAPRATPALKSPHATKSQHYINPATGKSAAFDIRVPSEDRAAVVNIAKQVGFGGIGAYNKFPNMIHLDTGPKRSWGPGNTAKGIASLPDADLRTALWGSPPAAAAKPAQAIASIPRPQRKPAVSTGPAPATVQAVRPAPLISSNLAQRQPSPRTSINPFNVHRGQPATSKPKVAASAPLSLSSIFAKAALNKLPKLTSLRVPNFGFNVKKHGMLTASKLQKLAVALAPQKTINKVAGTEFQKAIKKTITTAAPSIAKYQTAARASTNPFIGQPSDLMPPPTKKKASIGKTVFGGLGFSRTVKPKVYEGSRGKDAQAVKERSLRALRRRTTLAPSFVFPPDVAGINFPAELGAGHPS